MANFARNNFTVKLKTFDCIVLTDFQHTKLHPGLFLSNAQDFANFSLDIHAGYSYNIKPNLVSVDTEGAIESVSINGVSVLSGCKFR